MFVTSEIFYHFLAYLNTQATHDNLEQFHTLPRSQTSQKSSKKIQKFKNTRTHYFINQHSYLNISLINQQGYLWFQFPGNLIKWISFHAEVFKNFISRKKYIRKMEKQTIEIQGALKKILLLLQLLYFLLSFANFFRMPLL